MSDTGDKITAVDSQWERLSARNDSVTAASNRLAAAQAILADAPGSLRTGDRARQRDRRGRGPGLADAGRQGGGADRRADPGARGDRGGDARARGMARRARRYARLYHRIRERGHDLDQQATAAREAETVAFAANIVQANNATAAIKAHGISTGETTFIMRQFSLAGVSAFTGLATGAPIMSVLTQSVTQLGYELTLSRHGFTLLKEGVTEAVEALGGWTMTGVIAGVDRPHRRARDARL